MTFLTSNQSLNDGLDAVFLCEAEAYPTAITYSWFKDGRLILSDPSGQFYIDTEGLRSRLTAKQITKDSAGQYSCSGQNILGTGKRKSTFLAMNCKCCYCCYWCILFFISLSASDHFKIKMRSTDLKEKEESPLDPPTTSC